MKLIEMKSRINLFILLILIINLSCEQETPQLPTVITAPITEITAYTAISGGDVIDDGGEEVTARGICINTNPDDLYLPDDPNNSDGDFPCWYTVDSSGVGAFESEIEIHWLGAALWVKADHYVRAYATNNLGTAYGEVLSFTPKEKPLSVPSIELQEISTTATTALVNFYFHYQMWHHIDENGICYGTDSNPTLDDLSIVVEATIEGENSLTIENLTSNTKYYIRSYSFNESGICYGAEKSFTTK